MRFFWFQTTLAFGFELWKLRSTCKSERPQPTKPLHISTSCSHLNLGKRYPIRHSLFLLARPHSLHVWHALHSTSHPCTENCSAVLKGKPHHLLVVPNITSYSCSHDSMLMLNV